MSSDKLLLTHPGNLPLPNIIRYMLVDCRNRGEYHSYKLSRPFCSVLSFWQATEDILPRIPQMNNVGVCLFLNGIMPAEEDTNNVFRYIICKNDLYVEEKLMDIFVKFASGDIQRTNQEIPQSSTINGIYSMIKVYNNKVQCNIEIWANDGEFNTKGIADLLSITESQIIRRKINQQPQ